MKTTAKRMKLGWTRALARAAVAGMSMATLVGCELLVDFDRSKIPTSNLPDASIDGLAAVTDASADSVAPLGDGQAGDAGIDAASDGSVATDSSVATDGGDASTAVDASVDAAEVDGAAADAAAADDAASDLDAADASD